MDISIIGIVLFNFIVQKTSQTKDILIFNFLICNIEKIIALKSSSNSIKKLSIEYHKFLNIFSWVNSKILSPHQSYDHKILLIKREILF